MNRPSLLTFALALSAPFNTSFAAETAVEQRAQEAFASAIEEYKIPGLAVGVTHNGRHSF